MAQMSQRFRILEGFKLDCIFQEAAIFDINCCTRILCLARAGNQGNWLDRNKNQLKLNLSVADHKENS